MKNDGTSLSELTGIVDRSDGLLGKLLSSLSEEVRATLLSLAEVRDVVPGTVIVEDGAVVHEIGYVIDGTLAMIQNIDHSRKHIIGFLVPTDIYGRLFDGPNSYRIEALSDTRILSFPRAPFEAFLRQHPETERVFLVHLLDEMDAAREWLLLISGRKVINRAASFLTILIRRKKSVDPHHPHLVHLSLARKDLAHYLGTRPESLSRAFHELQDMGILRIIDANSFEILDPEALADISGEDLMVTEAKPTGTER
jgi:CRP/FNR family transcriptional regulator, anaerobic regulatory protein